jgi:cellulose 1,4-beta-cellobiosidase
MNRAILLAALLFASTYAQWPCGRIEEKHPPFTWHSCHGKECHQKYGAVVLDATLRQIDCCHGSFNINDLQRTACKKKNKTTCPVDCCIEGADYQAHGISTDDTSLTLDLGASDPDTPKDLVRVLTLKDDERYLQPHLIRADDSEYTFDLEIRNVPPGYKARVSLHWMWGNGGKGKEKGDKAGARYGTGYCDATCDQGQRFVHGKANYDGWVPSEHDPTLGKGPLGACCAHFVLWEGNTESTDFGFSPCSPTWPHWCKTEKCRQKCFAPGCTWIPHGNRHKPFYGPGPTNTIDSTRKFSVVNQWFSQQTPLVAAILKTRAMYFIQDGKLFRSPPSDYRPNGKEFFTMNKQYCQKVVSEFKNGKWWKRSGKWWQRGYGHNYPMVPVFSLFRDVSVFFQAILWTRLTL